MALASYGEPRLPAGAARAGARRPATAASASTPIDWARFAPRLRAGRASSTDAHADLARQRAARGSRRCCSSWRAGCTRGPATGDLVHGRRGRAELRGQLAAVARGPVRARSGCSRPRATRAPRSARRCTWRAQLGDAVAPMRDARPRPRLGRRRAGGRAATPPACAYERARPTSPTRSPRCWPPTASSPGSRAAREYGPRALGHRSLLAHPRPAGNLEKLNDIKGREQFRPVAPMVLAERAAEIFATGRCPSPYMLFVHGVRAGVARTASRPSCTSTAPPGCRPSTARDEPLVARMLAALRARAPGCRSWSTPPQHRRAADGRRPARRAGVLRLGAGRRCSRIGPFLVRRGRAVGDARRPRDRRVVDPDRRPAVSCASLLDALRPAPARAGRVIVVDDRPRPRRGRCRRCRVRTLRRSCRGPARGPAAARNAGWRAAARRVGGVPRRRRACRRPAGAPRWRADLAARRRRRRRRRRAACACRCPPAGARPTGSATSPGSATRAGRPPTWPTGATALAAVGGFDERFPRAFREDADLGLRVPAAGWRLVARRARTSPTRCGPAAAGSALRKQARQRRRRADAPPARPRLARARRRPAPAAARATSPSTAGRRSPRWRGRRRRPPRRPPRRRRRRGWPGTAEFAWRADRARARGRRGEVATMLRDERADPAGRRRGTGGCAALRRRRGGCRAAGRPRRGRDAVLFDRDGTLVDDVPYNGDPARVEPVPGAREALDRLRAAGVPVGVVTNQSGIARGLLTPRAGRRGQRRGSRSCSARSAPGRSARTARTTAAPAASPRPGWSCAPPRALGVDPRDVRGDRRHRRATSRRPRAAGARGGAGADRRARRAEEVARRRRRSPPTCARRRSSACWRSAAAR